MFAKIQPSNVDKKSLEDQETIHLCNYMDVYYHEYIDKTINFMKATASESQIFKFTLRKGDVIITKDSETPLDIAVPAYVSEDLPGIICGYHLAIIRPKNDYLLGEYLFRAFQSEAISNQYSSFANGLTRFGIKVFSIGNALFPIPPLNEQKSIITFLKVKTSEIDVLIVNKGRMVELFKEYRQALISETVTKGLNPNVEMKESGIEWIGEVPKPWDIIKLKYLAYVNPRKNYSNFSKDSDELVTFLPMERVKEDGTYDIRLKKKIHKLWKSFTYFEENDVIVAKITPCFENQKGACLNKLDNKFGFGSTEFHVLREIPGKSISKFLYYITKSKLFLDRGESLMTGAAGQKRVPTSFIQNFIVGTPPIEEQEKISKYLDIEIMRIDRIIDDIQNQIKCSKSYRQSLISEVVTGKINVSNHNLIKMRIKNVKNTGRIKRNRI